MNQRHYFIYWKREGGGASLNFWNMVHIAASISIFLKGFAKNFIKKKYNINSHIQISA